jgi:Tfp pilus assembly protein PilX
MSTHSRGKKKRSRGSILLLSIFFLIILFSLAVTFFRVIPAEFHSATQARRMVQAQYAADAGVREAVG